MATAAMLTVFAGFAPTYYFRSLTGTAPLSVLIHAHAVANSAWIVLFLGQATLVATGHTAVHRRLGIFGAVLATLIVVLGIITAVHGARSGWNPSRGAFPDALAFMMVGLRDIVVFAAFVTAGLCFRTRGEVHKRLMLLGTIGGLMWPAIARMPVVAGRLPAMLGLMAVLVIAPPVCDLLARRRLHPIDVWGGLVILASFPLSAAIARTAGWHSFAVWLIR
jgi:hypothetical protein